MMLRIYTHHETETVIDKNHAGHRVRLDLVPAHSHGSPWYKYAFGVDGRELARHHTVQGGRTIHLPIPEPGVRPPLLRLDDHEVQALREARDRWDRYEATRGLEATPADAETWWVTGPINGIGIPSLTDAGVVMAIETHGAGRQQSSRVRRLTSGEQRLYEQAQAHRDAIIGALRDVRNLLQWHQDEVLEDAEPGREPDGGEYVYLGGYRSVWRDADWIYTQTADAVYRQPRTAERDQAVDLLLAECGEGPVAGDLPERLSDHGYSRMMFSDEF